MDDSMQLKNSTKTTTYRIAMPMVLLLVLFCSDVAHAQFIVAHRGASHDAPETRVGYPALAQQ